MIELKLLNQALMLARHRHFGRAAEALHITQPTLSRNIAALEAALGVPLFDRGRRSVVPTAFGELLLAKGATLLGGEAELRREVRLLAGLETGRLAIGAGPYATEISVGGAVSRLLRAHPRLQVQVATLDPDEVVRQVASGRIDVGIAEASAAQDDPRLHVEPFTGHPIVLACRPGHPLLASRSLTLARVLSYPMVSTLLIGDAATVSRKASRAGSDEPDSGGFAPAVWVSSLSLAGQIASASDALFPATLSMIELEIGAGLLTTLDFHVPAMQTSYALVTRRERTLSPSAQAFVELLREVEAGLSATGAAPERRRKARDATAVA